MNSNIFIIGPSGVGKTTVGKKLSTMRNLFFYDVDCLIAERAGVDLEWILDKEGPKGFQDREEKIIAELSEKDRIVVATGAMAVESLLNRNNMSKRGIVVYLKPVEESGEEIDTSIKQYCDAADIIISTSNKSIKTVIDEILEQIKF